jgi:hypothetical protein
MKTKKIEEKNVYGQINNINDKYNMEDTLKKKNAKKIIDDDKIEKKKKIIDDDKIEKKKLNVIAGIDVWVFSCIFSF